MDRSSSDHVDLADGLMHPAGALPALREERDGVRLDLDHLAGFVGVGAAPEQEVAELVARELAAPVARRTDPDDALVVTVRPHVQQNTAGDEATLDHERDV